MEKKETETLGDRVQTRSSESHVEGVSERRRIVVIEEREGKIARGE